MRRAPGQIDAAAVKEALRSHDAGPNGVCCHDPDNERYADRAETLVSVCLDLDELRFEISEGAPCRSPYREAAHPRRDRAAGASAALERCLPTEARQFRDQACARARAEQAVERGHVLVHRCGGDVQRVGDLAVAVAAGHRVRPPTGLL